MKCLYGMLKNILLEFESDHVVFLFIFFYISTEQRITMKNEIVDFLTPEICQILKRFAGTFH